VQLYGPVPGGGVVVVVWHDSLQHNRPCESRYEYPEQSWPGEQTVHGYPVVVVVGAAEHSKQITLPQVRL